MREAEVSHTHIRPSGHLQFHKPLRWHGVVTLHRRWRFSKSELQHRGGCECSRSWSKWGHWLLPFWGQQLPSLGLQRLIEHQIKDLRCHLRTIHLDMEKQRLREVEGLKKGECKPSWPQIQVSRWVGLPDLLSRSLSAVLLNAVYGPLLDHVQGTLQCVPEQWQDSWQWVGVWHPKTPAVPFMIQYEVCQLSPPGHPHPIYMAAILSQSPVTCR